MYNVRGLKMEMGRGGGGGLQTEQSGNLKATPSISSNIVLLIFKLMDVDVGLIDYCC